MFGYLIFAVLISAASSLDCTAQVVSDTYECLTNVSTLIDQRLDSHYGIQEIPAQGLQNLTIKTTLVRAAKDVLCDESPLGVCLWRNIRNCSAILQEDQFKSATIGPIYVQYWPILNATTSACDGISRVLCEILKPGFLGCYSDVYEGIVGATPDLTKTCLPASRQSLTCIIDHLKICSAYVYTDEEMPSNFRRRFQNEKWWTYADGDVLCDCYTGVECWEDLRPKFRNLPVYQVEGPDRYVGLMALAEAVCKHRVKIACAYTQASGNNCGYLSTFTQSAVKDITEKYLIGNEICQGTSGTKLKVSNFDSSKDCITDLLKTKYHDCFLKQNIPYTASSCRDIRMMRQCLVLTMRGTCGEDFMDTALELLRGDGYILSNCDSAAGQGALPCVPTVLYCLGLILTVMCLR